MKALKSHIIHGGFRFTETAFLMEMLPVFSIGKLNK